MKNSKKTSVALLFSLPKALHDAAKIEANLKNISVQQLIIRAAAIHLGVFLPDRVRVDEKKHQSSVAALATNICASRTIQFKIPTEMKVFLDSHLPAFKDKRQRAAAINEYLVSGARQILANPISPALKESLLHCKPKATTALIGVYINAQMQAAMSKVAIKANLTLRETLSLALYLGCPRS